MRTFILNLQSSLSYALSRFVWLCLADRSVFSLLAIIRDITTRRSAIRLCPQQDRQGLGTSNVQHWAISGVRLRLGMTKAAVFLFGFLLLGSLQCSTRLQAQSLSNGSFETPSVGAANYQYNPTGGSWVFAGNSGIQSNGSVWGVGNTTNGTQTAFLQGTPAKGTLGAISQSVSFASTGNYVVSFQAVGRQGQLQPVKVSIDGAQVGGLLQPILTGFGPLTSAAFTINTTGAHTVMLSATDNSADLTTFVDLVNISLQVPDAPTGVYAYSYSGNKVRWNGVLGAVSYNLYRSTTSGNETLLSSGITNQDAQSFVGVDTSGTNGTTYYYKVVAVNASGVGAFSAEVSVTAGSSMLPASTLSAQPGNGQVVLTWTAVSGSSSYNLFRAIGSSTPSVYKTGITATTYTDTGLTNGTSYKYYVDAVSPSGSGNDSATITCIPMTTPTAPAGLAAQPGNGQVSLNWALSATATSYNVKRSTVSGGPYTTLASPTSTSYSDPSLTNGTTYYYVVTAINAAGESALSNQASAVPGSSVLPAPTGLKGVAGNQQASLTWGTVTGATSYNLYRSTGGSYYGTLYQQGLTGTTYSDMGLTNSTVYSYYVCAVNVNGQGSQSASISLTPGAAALAAPSLSVQSSGSTSVSLSWTSVTGAASYNVYRSTAAGGEGSVPLATGTTSTSYSDSGLTSGTTYYYKVVAVGPAGEGAFSNEASATPGATALPPPILKGTTAGTQNTLTWSSVPGATSYNLYRSINGPYSAILYQQGLTATTYSDMGLTSGTAYSYYVDPVSASGQGTPSNTVTLTPGSTALPAPLLTASTSGTYISLSWTSVTGAASYNLYRSTTAGGEGSIPYKVDVSIGTGTSFSDSSLTTGTTYYYTVAPVGPGGEGTASNEASATVGTAPLAAPILKGVAGATSNALTWNAVAGATSYNLYRSTGGSYYSILYKQGLTATSFTDNGLTAGTAYSYSVAGVNTSGQGTQSNAVSLTPGSVALAAALLSAQSSGSTYVSLSWTAVTGATSYNLYRSTTAGGEGSTPYITGLTSTSTPDSGLTSGTTYYYKVTAVGAGGEGASSNEASAIPGSTALAAPVLKGVASGTQNTLTWSAVTSATSYNLYRSTGGSYYGTLYQQGLTATTYSDIGLTSGTAYTYYVYAVNTSGQGNQSNSVSLTPGSAALAAPLLTASTTTYTSGGLGSISLSWTAITGASSYNLYRSTVAGGEGAVPYKTGLTSTSTSDSSLASGTTYYYKVVAVGPGGEGAFSNEASSTVGTQPLAAPILKGVAGLGQNALTWSAVTGAISYNLYRSTGGSYYGTLYQQGLAGTTYTDTGLTNGTAYSYYVDAVNTSGQGTQSNTVSLTPGSSTLPAPLLSAQSSSTQVTLTWTAVTGATSYDLYRSLTAGGEGATPYKTGLTGTSTSDTGLTNGTTYYYQVVAVGPGGAGTLSNEASGTPGATALAAPILKGTTTGTQNTLTWSAVAGATSYNLYLATGGYMGYGGTLYQQGLTATTFSDMGLTASTAYSYYVSAVNISGQGAQSNTITLTPGSVALAAPLLTASTTTSTNGGLGSILLSWTAVSGASSYNVYRSTTAGGEGSVPYQASQTGTSYSDGSLTPGTTYYYKVVAVGTGGEGAFSNEASATVAAQPLAGPLLKGVAGSGQVSLNWSTVSGATSYNLYRSNNGYGYGGTLYKQGMPGTSFTDTGLTNGTAYTYSVYAITTSGQGTQSNSVSLTPGAAALPAPSLAAQAYSNTQVNLVWTAVTGAASYDLYRSTSPGGEGAAPYQVNLTSTSYSDPALTSGTTYYYEAVAVGPGGEGTLSNEASATPGSAKLAAPVLTAAVDPTQISVSLSWSSIAGATSYNLYRGTGYMGYGTLFQQGLAGTSFVDTSLVPPGYASYYVTAVNQNGEGTSSNYVRVQINGFYLTCPASVTVTHGTTAAVSLALTPLGTFTGNVLLSGSATPAGTSGLFYPAAPSVNSAVQIGYSITGNLYLNVGSTTAPGSYPITITGTANGFTHSANLTLIVQ